MAFIGCVGSHTHDARLQAIEEAVKVSLVHTVGLRLRQRFTQVTGCTNLTYSVSLRVQLRFRCHVVGRLKVFIRVFP